MKTVSTIRESRDGNSKLGVGHTVEWTVGSSLVFMHVGVNLTDSHVGSAEKAG